MKKIITLLFICFLSITGFSQTFEKTIKSSYRDEGTELIINNVCLTLPKFQTLEKLIQYLILN
jgi:hypothetical protein